MARTLNTEVDEWNTGCGYNNTSLMEYFQGKMELVINRISRLEVKGEEDK